MLIAVVVIGVGIAVGTSAWREGAFQATSVQVFLVLSLLYGLTLVDLRAGMAALIVSIGISPEFAIGVVNKLRFEDLLMPVLCLAWLGRAGEGRERFASSPVTAPIIALAGTYVLASALGTVEGFVEPLFTAFRIAKFIEYYLIFWLFLNNIKTRAEFNAIVMVVLVTGAATGLLAVYEGYVRPGGEVGRASGPTGESTNTFGGYLVLNLAVFAGMFLGARTARGKFVCGGAILLGFWGIMLTLSRTSYIALLAGLLLFATVRRRAVFLWAAALALVFQVAMPAPIVSRAGTILDIFGENRPSSFNARLTAWEGLSHRILEYPLLGHGVGWIGLSDADNEYVLQLVQAGVLGLGLFLWFLWRNLRVGMEVELMTRGDPIPEGFAIAYPLALLCLAVHGLGSPSFTTIRTMEAFMVIAGIGGALHLNYARWKEEEEGERPHPFGLPARRPLAPRQRLGRIPL